ncbi:MAG: hypothetical protein WC773_01460 [Patescibacteria group bacterium]|jgi:hypothetical protein
MPERDTQSRSGSIEVTVGSGRDGGTGQSTTDMLIIDHDSRDGSHDHVVISESGETLHDTTRK